MKNSNTMEGIKATHVERIESGTVREFADGKSYLCSPTYGPVETTVYRTHLKSAGFKDLISQV